MGRESIAGTLPAIVGSGVPPGRKCFFYQYPVVGTTGYHPVSLRDRSFL